MSSCPSESRWSAYEFADAFKCTDTSLPMDMSLADTLLLSIAASFSLESPSEEIKHNFHKESKGEAGQKQESASSRFLFLDL